MPSPDENFPHKNDRTFHQRCLSRARDEPAETPLLPAKSDPARTHRRRRPPSCMIVTAMIVPVSPQWYCSKEKSCWCGKGSFCPIMYNMGLQTPQRNILSGWSMVSYLINMRTWLNENLYYMKNAYYIGGKFNDVKWITFFFRYG